MKILVTGGAGYIGSHTCVELLNAGHEVVVVDNLSGSKRQSLDRVQELTGRAVSFYQVDLLDKPALEQVFRSEAFEAVIHFAALKAPGEFVSRPLRYYHNNLTGTIHLLEVMGAHGLKSLVFSSSAAVYGNDVIAPVREDAVCSPINPYARTKWMLEMILRDLQAADPAWDILLLRYFNPVGAHASGRIGEDPRGIPNNIMPVISRVAVGRLSEVQVYGADYPTPDGTGIRDYIHVVDLAAGHLRAIDRLQQKPGLCIYNLGNNRGYSVLELIAAFEHASGRKIPYRIVDRRPGDIAVSYADASKANRVSLGWQGKFSLDKMCADVWRWQSQNPDGYPEG